MKEGQKICCDSKRKHVKIQILQWLLVCLNYADAHLSMYFFYHTFGSKHCVRDLGQNHRKTLFYCLISKGTEDEIIKCILYVFYRIKTEVQPRTYKPWIGNSPISVKRWWIICQLFPYCVALFQWICIGLYIVRKIRFNSMNHVGHVLKDYFNRTNPFAIENWIAMIALKKSVVLLWKSHAFLTS